MKKTCVFSVILLSVVLLLFGCAEKENVFDIMESSPATRIEYRNAGVIRSCTLWSDITVNTMFAQMDLARADISIAEEDWIYRLTYNVKEHYRGKREVVCLISADAVSIDGQGYRLPTEEIHTYFVTNFMESLFGNAYTDEEERGTTEAGMPLR